MKKYIFILGFIFLGLTSAAQAQSFVFSNNLSVGASGADVVALQTRLISEGYDIPAISSGVAVKGYFGSQTKSALMRFQSFAGLPSTGFFGPLTRGRLNGGNPPPTSPLNVLTPNGNEVWIRGSTQVIGWNGAPSTLNQAGTIMLLPPVPACAEPTQPIRCMIMVRAPYQIARVNLSSQSYTWRVGDYINDGTGSLIPNGNYKIQICTADSSVCDTSDATFTIADASINAPVINSFVAPSTLNTNQVGTWSVNATDPQNSTLSYSIDWGDVVLPNVACPPGYSCMPVSTASASQQGSTFTHSYSSPGVYTVRVLVRNSSALPASASATVTISAQNNGVPNVISPNGGESWQANSTQAIRWSTASIDPNMKLDIYLDRQHFYCITAPCPTLFVLDKNISVSTLYNWITGTDINNATIPAGDYKLRICLAGSLTSCDSSDNLFTILR